MTLIAGLVCENAIVFAADSEESGGIRKSNVEKIAHTDTEGFISLFKPREKHSTIMVAGAGCGPLCDFAAQQILARAENHEYLFQVEEEIRKILVEIHTVNIPLHPGHENGDADFELLIAVRSPKYESLALYSTHGAILVKRDRYFVCGSGALASYLLDQVYEQYMAEEDGVAASLYMLQVAKKYLSGVGGDTVIRVLRKSGEINEKPRWEITEEENLAKQYAGMTGSLFLSLLRTRTGTQEGFTSSLKTFNNGIRSLRKRKKKSDAWMDAMAESLLNQDSEDVSPEPSDSKQSDSEKSEDQQ